MTDDEQDDGHRVDLEQVLAHTEQRPFAAYANENLIQVLERGHNLPDLLRAEIIKRLFRLSKLEETKK